MTDVTLTLDKAERAFLIDLLEDPFTYATSRLDTPLEDHTPEMLAAEEIRCQLMDRLEAT